MNNNELIQTEPLIVRGLSVRTQNSDEFDPEKAKISGLWSSVLGSEIAAQDTALFASYSDYQSDANGFYTYTIGVKKPPAEQALNSIVIPSGKYLLFKAQGTMPQAVIETWKKIWAYFESPSPYQRAFKVDFESYLAPEEVHIYIGVK
jgi:predicted transcriptional regulator YdeE